MLLAITACSASAGSDANRAQAVMSKAGVPSVATVLLLPSDTGGGNGNAAWDTRPDTLTLEPRHGQYASAVWYAAGSRQKQRAHSR